MIKFQGNNVLVHSVSQVIEIESRNGGQPFQKRELIIDDSWEKNGVLYPNFVLIEFTGDRMSLLDNIYSSMRVNVEGMISGREYNNKIFTTVRGQSVTPYQPQQQYAPAPMPGYSTPQPQYQQTYQQTYQPAPMPGSYPQQHAQTPPTPTYQQQPAPAPTYQQPQRTAPTPSPAPSAPQQTYGGRQSPGVADLPFPH